MWLVTRHQYGISAVVSQTSFRGETTDGIAKCGLFAEATFSTSLLFRSFKATCKREQQLPTLLGVVAFVLAVVCNKMQQGVQTDATCDIQQC